MESCVRTKGGERPTPHAIQENKDDAQVALSLSDHILEKKEIQTGGRVAVGSEGKPAAL